MTAQPEVLDPGTVAAIKLLGTASGILAGQARRLNGTDGWTAVGRLVYDMSTSEGHAVLEGLTPVHAQLAAVLKPSVAAALGDAMRCELERLEAALDRSWQLYGTPEFHEHPNPALVDVARQIVEHQ